MKQIKETGFAAVNILTKPPHIMVWTISGTAKAAREMVADNWQVSHSSDDGWEAAKRDGVRVRRVEIKTV